MTREQLNLKIKEEIIKQASVSHQFDAVFKLFEAAIILPNNVLAEQYRDQLHGLLDLKLDTASGIAELTRHLIRSNE